MEELELYQTSDPAEVSYLCRNGASLMKTAPNTWWFAIDENFIRIVSELAAKVANGEKLKARQK